MTRLAAFNVIAKNVYCEPRFVAELEWSRLFSVGAQLMGQVPREELEAYVATGTHPNPDRAVVLTVHEPPDWDWWEPTTEWRRKAARDRDLDAQLKRLK